MIVLNRYAQRALDKLRRFHLTGRTRRHANIKMFCLMLSQKWVELDNAVNVYLAAERKRREAMEAENRIRLDEGRPLLKEEVKSEFFVKDGKMKVRYEPFQERAAEMIVFLVGFLRKSGIEDVEMIVKKKLEE